MGSAPVSGVCQSGSDFLRLGETNLSIFYHKGHRVHGGKTKINYSLFFVFSVVKFQPTWAAFVVAAIFSSGLTKLVEITRADDRPNERRENDDRVKLRHAACRQ